MDVASYFQWSCDKLVEVLDDERSRQERIRVHATTTFLILPGLVGVVLPMEKGAASGAVDLFIRITVLVLGSLALFCWFMTMRTVPFPDVSSRVFTDDDGTTAENDFEFRLDRARNYLLRAVEDARRKGDVMSRWRVWSLYATIATVTVLLVAVVKGVLA